MLRNRSRAVPVSSQQVLMADHTSRSSSSSSPQNNFTTQIHSFFHSPRFKAFIPKNLTETTEAIKSPTSILYNKSFLPFGYDYINNSKSPNIISQNNNNNNKQNSQVQNFEPKGIALVIVDTLKDKPKSDFGIKARNLLLSSSTFSSPKSGFHMKDSPRVINEMELSEDYTCVISHGPNPKTTHIFDDCIVDCCCSVSNDKPKSSPESFLSFCHRCKKRLEQKVDIYIYRGDKAFCSQECRYQEMILDEEENK